MAVALRVGMYQGPTLGAGRRTLPSGATTMLIRYLKTWLHQLSGVTALEAKVLRLLSSNADLRDTVQLQEGQIHEHLSQIASLRTKHALTLADLSCERKRMQEIRLQLEAVRLVFDDLLKDKTPLKDRLTQAFQAKGFAPHDVLPPDLH